MLFYNRINILKARLKKLLNSFPKTKIEKVAPVFYAAFCYNYQLCYFNY